MTKAFAYLRVSGKDQVSGDGFDRQALAIKAYAAAHDIKIVRTFREEGISGTKELENRPALLELMALLDKHGVSLMLIEKLDRLARDLIVQENIIADLRKHGFELVSVAEPDLLRDDPSRKLMRQIFGGIAEYEKTMIVLKLKGARDRMKARTGRCEGRKPFGHYPAEIPVLAQIRALRDSGLGFDRIAQQLNCDGIKPRLGERWHGVVVNRILSKGE